MTDRVFCMYNRKTSNGTDIEAVTRIYHEHVYFDSGSPASSRRSSQNSDGLGIQKDKVEKPSDFEKESGGKVL